MRVAVDPGADPGDYASALMIVARDGDAAARGMALEVLGAAPARRWVAVDEALRRLWWRAPRWTRRLATELRHGQPDTLSIVLAGCHYNGRIREAAVGRLAGPADAAATAVLALRSCDWVPQVRQKARAVVGERPVSATLAEVAFALAARRHGAWLAERVAALLEQLPAQGIEPLLSARDRRVRRAAYRAAIATGQLGTDRLVRAAVRDHDLPVRTMCARAAVAAADRDQLRALLSARTALVRAEALRVLTSRGDLASAEAALTDRHLLVRETAQAALRRAGSDPAAHYRRLVEREAPPAAIAGLGETGGPGDAGAVARWLSHPRARGRVEAIRALRRLGAATPAELVPLLRDGSAAVSRQAVVALRRDAGAVDPAELRALLGRGNPPHVRFAGYRLSVNGDAWQRLATDLRLVDDPDDRLRATARADLAVWLLRDAATAYRGPGPDRAAELDRLIEHARPILGEGRARLLRFHAGMW